MTAMISRPVLTNGGDYGFICCKARLDPGGFPAAGNWLSYFRIEVNYRHAYGCWYPYTEKNIKFVEIEKAIRLWNDNKFNIYAELQTNNNNKLFVSACIATITICKNILADICKLAGKKSLYKVRAEKFLKLAN